MSGRRIYPRFREGVPCDGQLRISHDVAVQVDERTSEVTVLSDAPAVVGEELTLALVSAAGTMEFVVRVAESRPQIVNGTVRHSVRLAMLGLAHDVG